ncbi:galactonate dehydratase [Micromonospora mirobrigensis]|uniref:Galactonate dehydratase n=1 Tax=Micromonospora mirobrigensis TaxID=262898 RepID=A0A1C5AL51_9ACTN|nr:galactonate dehydratase [Micromonospora mirobrigensis]SCF45724.1 galactonate dehydratase [Micromonospora mirobrigensis]
MKITGHELFLVAPRWLFLRIDTDEGISGWGEPIVEGRAETVSAAVTELFDLLDGADPLRTEHHWQTLAKAGFYRGGAVLSSAMAGIDQALWDIKGKAYGVPVHELLGGPVRDKVRVYGWLRGETTAELVDSAHAQAGAGLTAVKMNPWALVDPLPTPAAVDRIVARVAAVREAVGPDIDLALDFHGRFTTAAAVRILPLLEPLRPLFAEEPVLPEYSGNLRRVVDSTTIPIATGERLYSRWDFDPVLRSGIAVAQPDLSHAGGVSECRRIAAAAETHDVLVAPHCPLGPIAFAASLQLDLAVPNFLIQEQSLGLGYHPDSEKLRYLVDDSPFHSVDGSIPRLTGPGLGIEVDESAVRRAAESPHRWRNPVWYHADGALGSW